MISQVVPYVILLAVTLVIMIVLRLIFKVVTSAFLWKAVTVVLAMALLYGWFTGEIQPDDVMRFPRWQEAPIREGFDPASDPSTSDVRLSSQPVASAIRRILNIRSEGESINGCF
jgi:hypothetical protein